MLPAQPEHPGDQVGDRPREERPDQGDEERRDALRRKSSTCPRTAHASTRSSDPASTSRQPATVSPTTVARAAPAVPLGSPPRSSHAPPSSRRRNSASSITSTPSVSAFASFVPGSSPATTNAVFFDTLDATRAPAACARARRLLAGERLEPAGQHDRHPLERPRRRRSAGRSSASRTPAEPELLDQREVLVLVEPLAHGRRDLGPDLGHGVDLVLARGGERVDRAERPRQHLRDVRRPRGGC